MFAYPSSWCLFYEYSTLYFVWFYTQARKFERYLIELYLG
jgi:hypothetical protein